MADGQAVQQGTRWRAVAVVVLAPLLLLAHAAIGVGIGLRNGAHEIRDGWRLIRGR